METESRICWDCARDTRQQRFFRDSLAFSESAARIRRQRPAAPDSRTSAIYRDPVLLRSGYVCVLHARARAPSPTQLQTCSAPCLSSLPPTSFYYTTSTSTSTITITSNSSSSSNQPPFQCLYALLASFASAAPPRSPSFFLLPTSLLRSSTALYITEGTWTRLRSSIVFAASR